jgi:hypothetical protein
MFTQSTLVCLRLKVQRQVKTPLRMRPRRLEPCDADPALQYGSRTSCDFLAKILGAHAPLFQNTKFYFPLFSLLVRKSHKKDALKLQAVVHMVAFLPTVWAAVLQVTIFHEVSS